MTTRYEFDHVSVAVKNPQASGRKMRSELGAVPLVGGVLPEFRYVLAHVGTPQRGSRLELISPAVPGTGFIHRFIQRHGESAHHLSFSVPDLPTTRRELMTAGFTSVHEDLDYPRWRELFLPPDTLHGLVIQIASSTSEFPPAEELLASRHRDFEKMPNNRGANTPDWWRDMWEVPVGNQAVLGATVLGSTDMAQTDLLFRKILHGQVREASGNSGHRLYSWPTGHILVEPSAESGVRRILLAESALPEVRLGDIPLICSEGAS